MTKVVNCPTCSKPVEWKPENRFRPFCSDRCKKIDLGAWANEEYRVSQNAPTEDEDAPAEDRGAN